MRPGLTLADVVKTTIFLADIGDFAAVNAVYASHMPDPPPARSTFAVAALPKAALVEIEMIARRVRQVADRVGRQSGHWSAGPGVRAHREVGAVRSGALDGYLIGTIGGVPWVPRGARATVALARN